MLKKLMLVPAIALMLQAAAYARVPYNPNPNISGIQFSDVADTHWAKETICKLAAQDTKIFKGYPDGTFMPQKYMSRAEFITALIRVLDYEEEALAGLYVPFSDVPEDYWAARYISMAGQKGIITDKEYSNIMSRGMAEGEISRYEVCKMLVNSIEHTRKIADSDTEPLPVIYSDLQEQAPRVKRIAYILTNTGILKGYEDNTARIGNFSTRAELAAFILRFMENADKLETFTVPADDVMKEDYRDGVKYVGISELPHKMVKLQNYFDQTPLDVQVTINKVTMFKYDSSYKGQYKELLGEASTKVRYFTESPDYKLKGSNIMAIEAVTTNTSGYTISESGKRFEIYFPEEDTKIIDKFDNYFVEKELKNEVGTAYWLISDTGKNTYKYTTFCIVDKFPQKSIKLSRIFFTYVDEEKRMDIAHKDNYQLLGIDLRR